MTEQNIKLKTDTADVIIDINNPALNQAVLKQVIEILEKAIGLEFASVEFIISRGKIREVRGPTQVKRIDYSPDR